MTTRSPFAMLLAAAVFAGFTAAAQEIDIDDDLDWWDGWEVESEVESDFDEPGYPYQPGYDTEWEYDYDWWDGWEWESEWSETLYGYDDGGYYEPGYYGPYVESDEFGRMYPESPDEYYEPSELEYEYDWWDGWEIERDWSEILFDYDEDYYDRDSINLDEDDVTDYDRWYDDQP